MRRRFEETRALEAATADARAELDQEATTARLTQMALSQFRGGR